METAWEEIKHLHPNEIQEYDDLYMQKQIIKQTADERRYPFHTKPKSTYAQRKARSRKHAERRNNQRLIREAQRNQTTNQAEAGSENTSNQDETNSNRDRDPMSLHKGKTKGKGKGRGKARRHGLAAMSFGRSWSEEASEEFNRQLALDRYFR